MKGKVVLDTNVFIDYLSAVVLMELRIGANTVRRRRVVDRLKASFPPSRVVAPTPELFDRAAVLFRRIHADGQGLTDRLGAVNDLLIALSAWQIGAAVITSNARDFGEIERHLSGLRWGPPDA